MPSTIRKAIQRVPAEIWLNIFTRLPGMSFGKLAATIGTSLPPAELKHSKVWDAIFDSYEWLDYMARQKHHCMLLGYDLHLLYTLDTKKALREISEKNDDINLVLLCGEYFMPSDYVTSMFLRCLKKDASPIGGGSVAQVTIPYGRHTIRLSINQIKNNYDQGTVWVKDPKKLFNASRAGLFSAYIYWEYDNKRLRTLTPDDIVGVGKRASLCSTTEYVENVCGITMQQPHKRPAGFPNGIWCSGPPPGKFPWQVILAAPDGLLILTAKYENENKREEPRRCIGWEYEGSNLQKYNRELW